MLGLNCGAHQVALTFKPAIEKVPGLTSNLTRLGHLFESGTWVSKWVKSLDREADDTIWREVVDFPADAEEGARRADYVLSITKPVMDLTEQEEKFVKLILNCDWKGKGTHYHKANCECGGRGQLPANRRRAISLVVGAGCPLSPL